MPSQPIQRHLFTIISINMPAAMPVVVDPESGPRVDEGLVWQFKIVHPYDIDTLEDIEEDEDKASMLMNPQTTHVTIYQAAMFMELTARSSGVTMSLK